jgi:hypothetical protein
MGDIIIFVKAVCPDDLVALCLLALTDPTAHTFCFSFDLFRLASLHIYYPSPIHCIHTALHEILSFSRFPLIFKKILGASGN